jgi:hypothetical protein
MRGFLGIVSPPLLCIQVIEYESTKLARPPLLNKVQRRAVYIGDPALSQ